MAMQLASSQLQLLRPRPRAGAAGSPGIADAVTEVPDPVPGVPRAARARRPRATIVLLRRETARKASRVRCALFCERRLELTRHVAQVCEVRLHRVGCQRAAARALRA